MWCNIFHLIFAQVELHFNKYFKQSKGNRENVHTTEKPYQLSSLLPLLAEWAKPVDSFQCFKLVFGMLGNLKWQHQYVLCIHRERDVPYFIF